MIDKLIAEKAVRINDIVESYLPPADGFNRTVCEAMAYSVERGFVQCSWRRHTGCSVANQRL